MAVVFLIGPPAVGKMTVGQALERRTGFTLFHNHVSIEMVAPYFSYGTPKGRRLVTQVRDAFFEAFAENTEASFIFTFVWAFDVPSERSYIEGIAEQFVKAGHDISWVELEADFQERLKRNLTENRLAHKPTKRDLDWSDQHIREVEETHRFNSAPGEMPYAHYLRLDTSQLTADDTAQRICVHFGLAICG